MKHPQVDSLNRRLGESLGYVRGGMLARFAWKWAPDLPHWQRHFGKVWVLCEWKKPAAVETWRQEFGSQYPYPENGMYFAFGDSQLPVGQMPTPEMNQNYIWAIDKQMSTSLERHLLDVRDDVAVQEAQRKNEWFEYTQGFAPAFEHWDAGKRGGNISFGGL